MRMRCLCVALLMYLYYLHLLYVSDKMDISLLLSKIFHLKAKLVIFTISQIHVLATLSFSVVISFRIH